jgi:hypothetical protein
MDCEKRSFLRNVGNLVKKERGPYFQKRLRPDELQKKYMCFWKECFFAAAQRAWCIPLVNGTAIHVQAWTGPEFSRRMRIPDFKTICTWKWQGCQTYTPVAFITQGIFPVLISVRDWFDPRAIVWPEGLCRWRNSMESTGIDSTTFRVPPVLGTNIVVKWHIVPALQINKKVFHCFQTSVASSALWNTE